MDILKKENILRKFFIPILVAVISGLIILFVQFLTRDSKEIKYENIELNVFHNKNDDGISKIVNGQTNRSFFGHKVIFENTGSLPIKDFRVEYKLNSDFEEIEVTNLIHQTFPEKNFGEIKIIKIENDLIRVEYELVNSNERFETTIFHNKKAELIVYGKGEGVSVVETSFSLSIPDYFYFLMILPILFSLVAIIYLYQSRISKEDMEELKKAWDYYSESKANLKL